MRNKVSSDKSLPLMRKTFIEAENEWLFNRLVTATSLPLMRKTFIEARSRYTIFAESAVSSAYAEDFH